MVYRVLTMTDRNLARIQLATLAIFLGQAAYSALRPASPAVRWVSVAVAVVMAVALVWKIRQYRRRYPSNL
jgi:hypothetical protein